MQRLVNNISGCVKVIAPWSGNNFQYETVPYDPTPADRNDMKDYIGRIAEAACVEFMNNVGGGSVTVTNFARVDAASSVISWSGLHVGVAV